ncbi:hypothetical protein [Jannaschia seohaensis]|uniref:Uncharacterized protein n=1 Tax=Jannaschia seohaensis TaxID=475081 RepID=A0A2Y9AW87_9RHOB|nr:hypothetical protein [Jannaschia seohaensis]PWJ16988.1 hypothetical protein BCF38_107101 [Jannaschia seohaensis]SSA48296.1 hypothetical protein SAMN05421539_107101 [Jannaschia seohaensis]
MDITSSSVTMPTRPGKSAQAVGQMAKVAVAEAKAAGVELPKNAQGLAASSIAGGADPSSVFAALTTPPPVEEGDAPSGDPEVVSDDVPTGAVDGESPGSTPETVDAATVAAAEGYEAAASVISVDGVKNGSEIALELLKGTA